MTRHKFKFTIAYADTDAGGITYHGRYVEIAERARMNWLRGKSIPAGDGFVIKKLGVEYNRPLKLGDDVCVETEVVKVGNVYVDTEQYFLNPDNNLCAILSSRIAYVGSDMRLKSIPENLRNEMLGIQQKQK